MFSAIKLMQRELGPTHISADIGCHSFATFAPFSLGNSILGYGMSLASAAAVAPNMQKRPIAVMGDGGFWHNGLITGVASNLFNKGDGVLIVMQNGYASATGQQYIPSSTASRDGPAPGMSIEQTLRAMGVNWLRTVRTYSVAKMAATLKEAMKTAEKGLKVVIADGECQLARQRRVRAEDAEKLKRGMRVTRARYGVDDEICTGDHSCIRLSGCPSLTVKPSPDPLRTDPVATVVESCVGCGLCGEVAHAAVLCPSFYRAEIVRNATWRDRAQASPAPAGDRLAVAAPVPKRPLPHERGTDREGELIESRRKRRPPAQPSRASGGGSSAVQLAGATAATPAPVKLLIAALGGEGGGVLTQWIVSAAADAGLPVQSTSIPGVAQRTGATTYYIEIMPVPAKELAGKRPVLALTPGVGDIDVAVTSELMEAGRTVANGFVTPERTHVIASLSRFYAMDEKIAMGDGRFDQRQAGQGHQGARARCAADRHGQAGAGVGLHRQRRDARRHRRLRPAAARRPSSWKPPSAPTASRSTPICAASAPGSRPRAPSCRRPSPPSARRPPPPPAPRSSRRWPGPSRRWRRQRAGRRAPAHRLSGRKLTRGAISSACGRSRKPTRRQARTAGC